MGLEVPGGSGGVYVPLWKNRGDACICGRLSLYMAADRAGMGAPSYDENWNIDVIHRSCSGLTLGLGYQYRCIEVFGGMLALAPEGSPLGII